MERAEVVRLRIITCIFLTGFSEAIITGMSFPLFSLRLKQDGLSSSLIGLNATVGAIGIFLCGHLFPRFILRYGYRWSSVAAFLGALVSVSGLLLSNSVVLWFILRLFLGIFQAVLWVTTEAWLNDVADMAHRGRINGLFQALYSLGFLIGPGAIYLLGYSGSWPIAIMMLTCTVAIIAPGFAYGPILITETQDRPIRWRDLGSARGSREIMLVALLVGVCETAIYALLPVYGIERGLSPHSAVSILVAYVLGEVIIAFPVGWLADKMDKGIILAFSAIIASACMLLLLAIIHSHIYASGAAFLAGGLVVSLYNVALILLGARFQRANLPILSTIFSMAYAVGSVAGSTIGGTSMSLFGPAGFPIAIGSLLAGAGGLLAARIVLRNADRGRTP